MRSYRDSDTDVVNAADERGADVQQPLVVVVVVAAAAAAVADWSVTGETHSTHTSWSDRTTES